MPSISNRCSGFWGPTKDETGAMRFFLQPGEGCPLPAPRILMMANEGEAEIIMDTALLGMPAKAMSGESVLHSCLLHTLRSSGFEVVLQTDHLAMEDDVKERYAAVYVTENMHPSCAPHLTKCGARCLVGLGHPWAGPTIVETAMHGTPVIAPKKQIPSTL